MNSALFPSCFLQSIETCAGTVFTDLCISASTYKDNQFGSMLHMAHESHQHSSFPNLYIIRAEPAIMYDAVCDVADCMHAWPHAMVFI